MRLRWSCAGEGVDHGQDVRREEERGAVEGEGGSCRGVGVVGVAGCEARAGFDGDLETFGDESFDGVGKEGDAGLSEGGFFQNCKTQDVSSRRVGFARTSRLSLHALRQTQGLVPRPILMFVRLQMLRLGGGVVACQVLQILVPLKADG